MQLNDNTNLIGIKQDIYFNAKINASTFQQLDLNRIINKYYKMLQEDLRAINEDYFLVSTTADIPVPTSSYLTFDIPSDSEKIKSLWAAVSPANNASVLQTEYVRCAIINPNKITDPTYAFSNPTCIMFGSYFALAPILANTTTITKGLKCYYIPIQTDLVNDNDVPNIMSDYHDGITWGSLIDIAQRQGDDKMAKKADDMFTKRREAMKADAGNRILDTEPQYVEGQGNEGGWSFPFGQTGL